MKSNKKSNLRVSMPVSLKVFLYCLAAMFTVFFVWYIGLVVCEVWEPLCAISKEVCAKVFTETTIWLSFAVAIGAALITAVGRVILANQPVKPIEQVAGESEKEGATPKDATPKDATPKGATPKVEAKSEGYFSRPRSEATRKRNQAS